MSLDTLLDNTDRSSKDTVMYDKQMYQITLQITLNSTTSKSPYLCFTGVAEFYSVLPQDYPFSSYKPFWDKSTERTQSGIEH